MRQLLLHYCYACNRNESMQAYRLQRLQNNNGPGDHLDDGGSKHLWQVSQYLPDYTVQQPRRQSSSWLRIPAVQYRLRQQMQLLARRKTNSVHTGAHYVCQQENLLSYGDINAYSDVTANERHGCPTAVNGISLEASKFSSLQRRRRTLYILGLANKVITGLFAARHQCGGDPEKQLKLIRCFWLRYVVNTSCSSSVL
jgi:hypothetical protein